MLEAGEVINQRYQLQTKLGRNAGRQTWLAKDLEVENEPNATDLVVVKLLSFGGDVQWEDLKLFEREAQILQQLNHDRIPRYQDYFAIDERHLWFGLVQQYIPGDSLKQLLDKGKRFSELEATQIAEEILQILLYLHDFQPPLLHRDLKPSNLILGTDNQIYLVDFGAVQDRAAAEGATFTVVGTYGYVPLEQFGGKAVPASDLYALGATLIHLLTRTPPADLPSKDLKIQFSDRVTLKPHLVNWLEKITNPALEKRFTTAREALTALSSFERENNFNLTKSRYAHNDLLFSDRIQIHNERDYLEINIAKRGIKDIGNASKLIVVALLFFLSTSLFFKIFPFSLIILIIFFGFFSPYFYFLFGESKVVFDRHFFVVNNKLFFQNFNKGNTKNIQDISINYQAIKKQENYLNLDNSDTISIVTQQTDLLNSSYQQYTFGKDLTEKEAIWLANEIRNWLNQED
jgi:serine/threonine protein kinase